MRISNYSIMNIFRNVLIIINFVISSSFLTNYQIKSISTILKYNFIYNSELSHKQFNELNTLYSENYNHSFSHIVYETKKTLFKHSLPFVRSKYNSFIDSSIASKRLSYSDKNVLLQYGYMGLWKAIQNYDGTSNFYKYSDIYVTSEFKRGLSDINSNFILPHRLRVNKGFLKSNNMSNFYVSTFSHIDANYEKSLVSNFNDKCHLETPETMYEVLHMLTPKERNYFTYRYNVYTCKIQRTNKQVAQLMCVSEETARKEIIRITKIVVEFLQNIYDD